MENKKQNLEDLSIEELANVVDDLQSEITQRYNDMMVTTKNDPKIRDMDKALTAAIDCSTALHEVAK